MIGHVVACLVPGQEVPQSDEEAQAAAEAFQRTCWGQGVQCGVLDSEVYDMVMQGFCEGDRTAILQACRREENNAPYGSEEISAMESALEEESRTLILPFCYTPGALALKASFVRALGHWGADVEVGVYLSRVGGRPTPYHYDNNHNITIQLAGHKDWHCLPGVASPWANRPLDAPPRNQLEQQVPLPSPAGARLYHLEPGSVIYLPPGYWHQVVPVEGESLSVDVRIGHVPHARWVCEALFHHLAPLSLLADGRLPRSPSSQVDACLANLAAQLESWGARLPSLLQACPIPRPLVGEEGLSDGMLGAATLEFLREEHADELEELLESVRGQGEVWVRPNPLVAFTCKAMSAAHLLLHLCSVSALTQAEYFRFQIYCPTAYQGVVDSLVAGGPQPWTESAAPLLQVLLLAQVITLLPSTEPSSSSSSSGGASPPHKKRKRDNEPKGTSQGDSPLASSLPPP